MTNCGLNRTELVPIDWHLVYKGSSGSSECLMAPKDQGLPMMSRSFSLGESHIVPTKVG
jgi:hypothetical protein